MKTVEKITLRCFLYDLDAENVRNCWLHRFADASQHAYRASDQEYEIKYDLILEATLLKHKGKENVKDSDFLVSYYDDHVWIVIACYIDETNGDIEVKFMHPAFPSKSFHWPRREDKCFVQVTHVVCVIKAPTTG